MNRIRIRRGFWSGYIVSLCVISGYQDFVGKDRYLEMVRTGWLDTRWWMWLLIGIFFMISGLKVKDSSNA